MKNFQLLLCTFFLAFLSCKDHASEASLETADTAAVATTEAIVLNEGVDSKVKMESSQVPNADNMKFGSPKIIRNANLRFETADLENTYKNLLENCKKNNALIQNDVENNDDYRVSHNVTIRIPAQNFDVFLAQLSSGVSYFERKEISSQDVTAEFIDNESRIASKKKLENRYLELLKKATKVQEMLEIEKQLSEIREEIEAKEGQQKYLQNKVSMSTIEIEFFKNTPANEGARLSFFGKIWNAIVSGFNSIANFFINLIEIWPFIIILVAIIYFIRKRILKKKQA